MIKLFGHETDGVIFDLDGTLLDSMWVWNKVDEDFLAENGIAVTSDYTEAVKQMHFNEAALYTKNRYNLSQSTQQIKDRWIEMVEKEYAEEIFLKPYAYEALKTLLARGVKVGYATTLFGQVARPCLKHNGIDSESLKEFCPLTTIEEVERGKGFPDIYQLAAKKLSLNANRCMVFEDIPLAIDGAMKGGFNFCGVYDKYSNAHLDFKSRCKNYIHDFNELLTEIKKNV